jgi:hypothetical protein
LWKHELRAQLQKKCQLLLLHIHGELQKKFNSKTTQILSGRLCKRKYIFFVVLNIACYYEKTGWW